MRVGGMPKFTVRVCVGGEGFISGMEVRKLGSVMYI